MSQIDLVYVHVPCPKCNEKLIPLMAFVVPCDYDEDGHSNGIEVDTIICDKCGELHDEAQAICEQVIDAFYHLHDLDGEKRPLMADIGTVYSYYSKETPK